MIKGTGKRMVPERDIKYLEDLKANHTDPTVEWGTKVVANPTLSGTEADLEGLEVNGVKYKAGGGSASLYRYIFRIDVGMGDYEERWYISFISSQNVDVSDVSEDNVYTILTTLLKGKYGVTCLQYGINNSQTYVLLNTTSGLYWGGAIPSESASLLADSNYLYAEANKTTV